MKKVYVLAWFVALAPPASAQQPFSTDDAGVTPRGVLHIESFDEYDWLQRSQAPHLRQNTINMRANYGLGHDVELDLDGPLITIVNEASTTPRRPFGFGDTNFGVKYNARSETASSAWPALAAALYIEIPTGDTATGLGSGLTDVWMYGVVQKTLGQQVVVRGNAGYLFTGNPSTGVVGITQARGRVVTMSASIAKRTSDRLTLGAEVAGAVANTIVQDRAQLQVMLGGNWTLREALTLDVGIIAGHFSASPRIGVQVGFSLDRPLIGQVR